MFPKYDKKQFANVVTDDETWVHNFEPVRNNKINNKIWATKHSKRRIIARRSLSAKKVFACGVYGDVFLCCPFSHEVSWMRS